RCVVGRRRPPLENNQFFRAAGEARHPLLRAVCLHVLLCRVLRVLGGMNMVPVRNMRVVGGFLMGASFVMLGGLVVVARSVFMMSGGLLVVIGCFL
ncbi:MAG: hypothetical protein WAK33_13035, partial [Silvibacterium sp.]